MSPSDRCRASSASESCVIGSGLVRLASRSYAAGKAATATSSPWAWRVEPPTRPASSVLEPAAEPSARRSDAISRSPRKRPSLHRLDRPLDPRLERLERVAAEELRVQAREHVGAADVVEEDDLAADPDQDAGLAVQARQRGRVLVDRGAALDVDRLLRARRRRGLEALRLRRDLVPDGLLARPALLAERRVGRVRRGLELGRAERPAARLDAAHRQARLRVRRDERELLDDPVLLRADELLALVEQDELVERVLDQELADDRLGVDLRDERARARRPRRGRRTRASARRAGRAGRA